MCVAPPHFNTQHVCVCVSLFVCLFSFLQYASFAVYTFLCILYEQIGCHSMIAGAKGIHLKMSHKCEILFIETIHLQMANVCVCSDIYCCFRVLVKR